MRIIIGGAAFSSSFKTLTLFALIYCRTKTVQIERPFSPTCSSTYPKWPLHFNLTATNIPTTCWVGFDPSHSRTGWPCLTWARICYFVRVLAMPHLPFNERHRRTFNVDKLMLADGTSGLTPIQRTGHTLLHRPAFEAPMKQFFVKIRMHVIPMQHPATLYNCKGQ